MERGTKGRPDLRIVKGTERPDRTPLIATVEAVDPSTIKRPAFVRGRARKIWETEAPSRIADGFLRPEDAHLFGQLCQRMADYETTPELFKATDLSELRKRMEVFGMAGPSSRARFKVDGKTQADPAAKYLTG